MAVDRANGNLLVSVVMPCWGQLEYSKLSVPRLLKHSRQPFEVLFVDAGSLDGTREYLAGVADAAPVPVELFLSSQQASFKDLVEAALRKAQGSFVAWVNNDVLVPELWLEQLVALVTANEKLGLVGPMSNLAGEHQLVEKVPYRLMRMKRHGQAGHGSRSLDMHELDQFAKSFRDANRTQWKVVDRLNWFCWLARRDVLQTVGALDKEPGRVFDECKFAERVRQRGFHLVCCRDLFVHNFGRHMLDI